NSQARIASRRSEGQDLADLLEEARAQVLRLVDDDHGFAAHRGGAIEQILKAADQRAPRARLPVHLEGGEDGLAGVLEIEPGTADIPDERAGMTQCLGEAMRQAGLSRADVPGQQEEPIIRRDRGGQRGENCSMRGRQPDCSGIDAGAERGGLQTVVPQVPRSARRFGRRRLVRGRGLPTHHRVQSPSMDFIASRTGLGAAGLDVVASGRPPLRTYLATQSYCSQPLRGASRSTTFHFGWPFLTSQSMLPDTVWANLPIRSQSL